MRSKELSPVIKNALRIGAVIGLAGTLVSEREAVQSAFSQVPSPQGIVENLKGPMPFQQSIAEQVRVLVSQGLASQGDPLQSGEREQTAEIKTDILIFETAYDPINGVFWTIGRHPSKGDAMGLYKGRYNEEKISWQKITEFPWMGTLPGMVAVSPTESNILTVAGGEQNQSGPGKILISKDGAQTFQEITVPDMGAVNYVTFSKNGDKIYYSTNNSVATAGIVVKVNVSDTRRETAANNGLEKMQNFGGPLLASPNSNETLYAVSGIEPAILRTQDGGQNWEKLFYLPSPIYSTAVVNWQGKDMLLMSGVGWLKMSQDGGQPQQILDREVSALVADSSSPELKIYGTHGTTDSIESGGINPSSWHEFPSTGLPTGKSLDKLTFVSTPDGEKWLVGRVLASSTIAYGLFAYRLSQGETSGSWQQMSEGLEWKDPRPFKVYLPSLWKNASGGW